jgi:serine/threonine-protein kinase
MAADEFENDKTQSFTPLTRGMKVRHYTIIEKIGSGGMGEVYLALDTKLNRKVALKILPPHLCQDEECRKRFTREAQAAAILDHPNIAAIYEVGEHQERPFYSMQVVEGQSLRDVIAGKDLPIDRILEIGIQVCEGLQAAHDKGIIHRDVKPSNILLDSHGRVRIVDFGLAAIRGSEHLTRTGSTLGTIGYMSPEQVRGQEIDHRSDLFSIGIVLYELITKQNPFKRDSEAATLKAVSDNTLHPVARYRADVPEGSQAIIEKALEKRAELRYQTAADMAADLRRVTEGITAIRPDKKRYQSIAVLPFVDISQEKDQEYFCDGIAEELINGLTQLRELKVAARTSAFQFRQSDRDIRAIGQELRVAAVLEGSVRKAGNRLRISVQLVNVKDGFHLWSEKYDRDQNDIFAIQDEIALKIVEKLRLQLLDSERNQLVRRHTDNKEAYNLYLKGRYFWNRRYEGGLFKAIECFQQATEEDPRFALAYSGIADSYNILGVYSLIQTKEAYTRAKSAAKKALEIDETIAEAHASLGWIRMWYDWDWQAAEKEFRQAIRLNPNCATAHQWYGFYLALIKGQSSDAIAEFRRAQELDPLEIITNATLGWVYFFAGKYDEAIRQCRKTIEMEPNFSLTYFFLGIGMTYIGKAMLNEAISAFEKLVTLSDNSPYAIGCLGYSQAKSGQSGAAARTLEQMGQLSEERYVSPFWNAIIYLGLGKKTETLAQLDRAYQERESFLICLKSWSIFDDLRSEPRFEALLRKIGLE